MEKKQYIIAIEIGSSKIVGVIAQKELPEEAALAVEGTAVQCVYPDSVCGNDVCIGYGTDPAGF